MVKHTISIIIPTQGTRPVWLAEAIASVKAQTEQPLEIIVADPTYGLDKFNKAISECRGEFFVILCDDDILDPTFIEKTMAYADQHDIISTALENFGDDTGVHQPGHFPFISTVCRKSMWEKVGGFDISVGAAADADFWFMCLENGARWYKIAEPLFKYRRHPTQDSKTCDWDFTNKRILEKHGHN